MTAPDLLPCPFCGEKGEIDGTSWRPTDGEEIAWVTCKGCKAYGPTFPVRQAIKAWNTRTTAPLAVPEVAATAAARDVLSERARQVSAEGWTPEHDDAYQAGDLANAAACYAATDPVMDPDRPAPVDWPWSAAWWKPTDRRRDLVKAAALILAEIERIDRAALAALREGGEG